MGTIVTNDQAHDVFVADYFNAAPKGELGIMEFPYFALSKKPDLEVFTYHNKKTGMWLEVAPSVHGRANIYDKDILLYCTGQIVQALNKGEPVSRRVRMTAYDYLEQTLRGTGGDTYNGLHDSLARLRGTTCKTNLYGMGGREVFGLIDEAEIVSDRNGRMMYIDVVLGRRMFNEILQYNILTYSQDYFTLGPNERRAYELVHKHCGEQPKWQIGIDNLHTKFGTRSTVPRFRQSMNKLVERDRISGYSLELDSLRDMLIARPRS